MDNVIETVNLTKRLGVFSAVGAVFLSVNRGKVGSPEPIGMVYRWEFADQAK
jgi:hypothetical protein